MAVGDGEAKRGIVVRGWGSGGGGSEGGGGEGGGRNGSRGRRWGGDMGEFIICGIESNGICRLRFVGPRSREGVVVGVANFGGGTFVGPCVVRTSRFE